ncbi:N-acetylmuramoyl-L-alanine amidase [Nocardiopsis sediminis]|uniref:N-acetylmuramoyl-L-alanine amidase n=1 Tax=Nocardiopsis sediminis TaxID=1778267 RepID=A0ABV8FKN0_9ACTN
MPKPQRYVSRNDLGWGASPASSADPKSGLVIHYDSSDQGLAGKAHSSCISYWRNTRNFHTGPSRGWVDIGYCVDEQTEILTEDGWRSFLQIAPGDVVLTLDHTTGLSRWQPLGAMNEFPAMRRELVRMEGEGHSSLTTTAHRWPVVRPHGRAAADGPSAATRRGWTTTAHLGPGDRIPLSAPCGDLPAEAKWSDPLVESVAWCCTLGRADDETGGHLIEVADPGLASRVRAALRATCGPPSPDDPEAGARSRGMPRWWESADGVLTRFRLGPEAARVTLDHAPGGVPRHSFLRTLTRAQLALFVEAAGGGRAAGAVSSFGPVGRRLAEAFQFAATLAGHATALRRTPPASPSGRAGWRVDLRSDSHLAPLAADRGAGFSVTTETYTGRIWCPSTPDRTWLARRAGTVYFTGNSFMACPHGYVIEGRGLFKQQAAQPGGNSTYYSVTLATGPSDPITDAQIEAVRQLLQWLVEPESSISRTVKGHRDFISTSCPGDKAYAMVRDGTFRKAPSGSFPPDGEDDMPKHRRFEKDDAQELASGQWASLVFDRRHDGATGELYSLVGVDEPDGALYDLSVGVTIEGLAAGAEVQIRATEYEEGGGGWEIARNRPIDSPVQVGGNGHFTYSWKGNLAEGRRVRVRIAQFGGAPATISSATADVFYWPK